jgi:hypothetical protein
MMGINVWCKSKLKLYSVLIGMGIGYLLSLATGLMSPMRFARSADPAMAGVACARRHVGCGVPLVAGADLCHCFHYWSAEIVR